MPAWVGSEAALFSVLAVMAWSIVLLAMKSLRDVAGRSPIAAAKARDLWPENEKAGANPGLS